MSSRPPLSLGGGATTAAPPRDGLGTAGLLGAELIDSRRAALARAASLAPVSWCSVKRGDAMLPVAAVGVATEPVTAAAAAAAVAEKATATASAPPVVEWRRGGVAVARATLPAPAKDRPLPERVATGATTAPPDEEGAGDDRNDEAAQAAAAAPPSDRLLFCCAAAASAASAGEEGAGDAALWGVDDRDTARLAAAAPPSDRPLGRRAGVLPLLPALRRRRAARESSGTNPSAGVVTRAPPGPVTTTATTRATEPPVLLRRRADTSTSWPADR